MSPPYSAQHLRLDLAGLGLSIEWVCDWLGIDRADGHMWTAQSRARPVPEQLRRYLHEDVESDTRGAVAGLVAELADRSEPIAFAYLDHDQMVADGLPWPYPPSWWQAVVFRAQAQLTDLGIEIRVEPWRRRKVYG